MKFAYLILAHDNFKLLQRLVEMLDNAENDIYLHFDKKVKELPELKAVYSKLFLVQDRVDVRWGTVSQIRAIFSAMKAADSNGPYEYYHLISGTHLPLKGQDAVRSHFSALDGMSALRLWEPNEGEADFKMRRIHWAISNFQAKNMVLRRFVQHFWTLNMFIQRKLGIRINKKDFFIKADEWASLSQQAVTFLMANQKEILRKYRYAFCGDEFFLASELSRANIRYANDQNLLYVSFVKDHPATLSGEDYVRLKKSEFVFARKFNDSIIS